jgi:ABC-type dipeptide/oligopeptide/nickel transport system permease component
MLLTSGPTTTWLRATAIVFTLLLALLAGVLALLGSGASVVAVVLAVLVAVGIAVPAVVTPLYVAFALALRVMARVVRSVMQGSCFAVVTAAGLTRTSLVRDGGARRSAWTEKEPIPPDAYSRPFPRAGTGPDEGWARIYADWATATGGAWALGLVPFLALMRSAQAAEDHELRGEIYALY